MAESERDRRAAARPLPAGAGTPPRAAPPEDGTPPAGGPCGWTLDDGAVVHVDRAVALDGIALISGWRSDQATLAIDGALQWIEYRRPDATRHLGRPATGFLAAVAVEADTLAVRLGSAGEHRQEPLRTVADAEPVGTLLSEQFALLHRLLPTLLASPLWGRLIQGALEGFDELPHLGVIDDALWVDGIGVAVRGRVIGETPTDRHYLVSDRGEWVAIDADPSLAVDPPAAAGGGRPPEPALPFTAVLHGEIDATSRVRLVLCREGGLHPLASARHRPAPHLAEFARRLFAHPVAPHRFAARVARHDLALVEERLRIERRALAGLEERREEHGRPAERPRVSVVVPLYGRWDFVEHQLISFAADPGFAGTELIYVIDDPRMVTPLSARAAELHALYGVPFSLVPGRFNRGFAGACNLGAGHAHGEVVIFVNSDLFPEGDGWASALADALARHPDYGVLGARLESVDGGIQHDGIEFAYDPTFGIWVNRHPGQGLPGEPPGGDEVVERVAVTGACMAVRREQFLALGGFDQGYLIGDFEDSDLCLKYRAEGLRCGLLPHLRFTHLERQSIPAVGDGGFRQKVVIWNAVRHHRRWGETLERLAERREDDHG